jgi:hypothetical protein
MDAASEPQGPVFRLVYRSRFRVPADRRRAELGAIFSTARSHNSGVGVSGALLIWNDAVVQVLEGDEETVRSLYARIHDDPRHDRVHLVSEDDVPARVFPRWSMAWVADEGDHDIPLLMNRDKGGASPAAPRRTTPEQDELLGELRELLREDETQPA